MPTFGDFETIGEPISVTEQAGHVSTVWRARKSGTDTDPTHAIKCFAPHRRKAKEGEPEDALDKDRGLEFLEGIKQLKKAQAEGGRCLAPIHAFGFADQGAWYVTDFYPRNTLKAWVARRGSVDSAALRQVVHCIVTGCLALKQSRGYSHGNLKATNVFLVGKPQPLRKTALQLADAYPAAPLQLARLVGEEKHTVDELLHQVMEVQDLRALGELLLQLVEGRLVSSSYDYNYPIAAAPAWERLGREADRWRELCNRLLDPSLSLEKISLESLAKEFRPSGINAKLPVVLGASAIICVVAGVVLWKFSGRPPSPKPTPAANEPPVAVAQAVTVTAGAAARVTLRGSDPENQQLTYTVVEGPKVGRLSGTPPALTYTTDRSASGGDSFTFRVSDGVTNSAVATVSLTISTFNEPPVAVAQTVTVTAGEAARLTLSGSDPEGAALKYEVVSQPTKGRLSGAAPALTYTTDRSASGSDSFTFRVSDGATNSPVATVSLTISKVNEPPVAVAQTVTVTAGEAARLTLSGSDPEGVALKYEVVSQPTKGRLSGTAPALTYTTDRSASGSDSFTFRVSDGVTNSAVAMVSLTISKVNEPPVAVAQTVTVTAGEAARLTLSGNDPEGAALKYEVVTQPTKGKLNGTAPVLTYSTDRTASGSDSFTFRVSDGVTNSTVATVSLTISTVNEPPVAAAQSVTVTAGAAARLTLRGSDPENQQLTYTVVEGPKVGRLSGTPPALTYTTDRSASGSDSFTFRVSDGVTNSAVATVSLAISKVNEPPVAVAQAVTVTAGEVATMTLGGSDPEGVALKYELVSQPTKGKLSGTAPALTYTTDRSASGSDSFTFRVSDGVTNSAVATVSLTISKANEPPVAVAQTVTVTAGEAARLTLSGSDPEGVALKYEVVSQPTKGRLSGTAPALTYTTDRSASGSDSLTFRVSDGATNSAVATVSVTINKVNEPPVAVAQTVTVTAGEAARLTLSGNDPEGAALKYEVVTQPAKGKLNGTAPALTYSTDRTASGSDSFTFRVSDGTTNSTVATVSVTINKANEPPVAVAQTVTVTAGEVATLTLGGSDPEGAALKYEVASQPTKGRLSGTAPALTYTTDRTASGRDSFTFRVSDGATNSAVATVSVTINKANEPPVAVAQSVTVTAGEAATLTLGGSDPEGAALKYEVVSQPSKGRLSGTAPALTYVTDRNASGSDSFTFRVSDGATDSAMATVSLTINNEFLRMMDEAKQSFDKGQYDDAANSVKKALDLAPGDDGAKSLQARIEQAKDARRKLVEVDRVLEDLRKQLLRGAKPQWMTVPESTKRYIDSDVGLVFISQCTDVLKKIETNYAAVLDKDRKDLIKSLRSNLANRN